MFRTDLFYDDFAGKNVAWSHDDWMQSFSGEDLVRHSREQFSYNLRKFPQIYAVSLGLVLVLVRILYIILKRLLLSYSQPSSYKNMDMKISCESPSHDASRSFLNYRGISLEDD